MSTLFANGTIISSAWLNLVDDINIAVNSSAIAQRVNITDQLMVFSPLATGGGHVVTGVGGVSVAVLENTTTGGIVGTTTVSPLNLVTGSVTAFTISPTGSFLVPGLGKVFQADFSNGTHANRFMFQNSTVNGSTTFGVIPNGTGVTSQFLAYGGSNPALCSFIVTGVSTGQAFVNSSQLGGGVVNPLYLQTNSTNRVEIGAAGHLNVIAGNVLQMSGTQVVTVRQTGWGIPTGTLTKTTFVTSTVTLPQLAERVAALIIDLRTHGLIGN